MAVFDPSDELICLRADSALEEAVLPPIVQASLFRKARIEDLLAGLDREHAEFIYSRGNNPTVAALEQTLASLERGEAAKCVASGMAAVSAVLIGLLKSGDHILFVNDIYGPTIELAVRLQDFGVVHSRIFSSDAEEIAAAMTPATKIVYVESPGSMLFGLAPIREIAAMAKARGALTVIDNTVATPLLQKPIGLGADIAIHSCTKYIGGHSDAVGGAVIGSHALIERIFYKSYMLLGGAMAPMHAFLFQRGLMTLPARLARHSTDALEIAKRLSRHPRVRRVFHPALDDTAAPLFASQMRAHSGLFSLEIDTPDFNDLLARINRLKLFGKAVSWGGAESLVITGHKKDPGATASRRIPTTLIRLSVGLEGFENLMRDLEGALA